MTRKRDIMDIDRDIKILEFYIETIMDDMEKIVEYADKMDELEELEAEMADFVIWMEKYDARRS